jgi:hypothetical protein
VYDALSYWCIRHQATSAEALSYQCRWHHATSARGRKIDVVVTGRLLPLYVRVFHIPSNLGADATRMRPSAHAAASARGLKRMCFIFLPSSCDLGLPFDWIY